MSDDKWVTWNIPEGIRKLLAEAVHTAEGLNRLECNSPPTAAVGRLDALERILIEWLNDNRMAYWMAIQEATDDSALKKARLLSLERDGWRCVPCAHSETNSARALHSHHIIPRAHGAYAHEIVGALHDVNNLISLCSACHDKTHAHNAMSQAPRYFDLIGRPDLAMKMEEVNRK